jgi:hypothetical protein
MGDLSILHLEDSASFGLLIIILQTDKHSRNQKTLFHCHTKVLIFKSPKNRIFLFSPQKQYKYGTLQAKQKYQQTSNSTNLRFSSPLAI